MANEILKIKQGEATQKDWHNYFVSRNSDLETDYSRIVSGVKSRVVDGYIKVGYNRLRDFFNGDQWQYEPEGGQIPRVYNLCRGVVINYTAFMTNEPLSIDVPPLEITDEEEVARAEAKERVLRDILIDNNFNSLFESACQNGSLLGDSVILGPFYDAEEDRIWIQNVKKPENVRIIWADDTYSKIIGFIHHYFLSEEKAYEMFPKAVEEKITFQVSEVSTNETGTAYSTASPNRRMVEVMDCWTKDVHMVIVGNKDLVFEENKPGFVPIIKVANIIHPTDAEGTSDIEDLLDTQTEYNERNSDFGEITSETAFPWIWGKNLDPAEVKSGKLNMIDIGDEGEIINDPRRPLTNNLVQIISSRLSIFYQLSGLNENIFGGSGVRAVTGRALSVLMQTVNNRIKGRQLRWSEALQELFKNIFILVEEYADGGKELIGGYYKTDIIFPGTLLRNITDEINKFNAKLQSQETTMKNLDIPSPKDERKLMKKELEDQITMIEISRNPALQLQVHQMLAQELSQKVAGRNPQLREDENAGGEMPSANGGAGNQSPVSPEGAVSQSNQRNGANVNLEE